MLNKIREYLQSKISLFPDSNPFNFIGLCLLAHHINLDGVYLIDIFDVVVQNVAL